MQIQTFQNQLFHLVEFCTLLIKTLFVKYTCPFTNMVNMTIHDKNKDFFKQLILGFYTDYDQISGFSGIGFGVTVTLIFNKIF